MKVDVEGYREDGFMIVPGLVSSREVESIRSDAVKICRGEYPCETIPPVPTGLSDEEVLSKFLCIHQPHKISPLMREMVAGEDPCAWKGTIEKKDVFIRPFDPKALEE